MRTALCAAALLAAVLVSGCTRHEMDVKAETKHEVAISVKDPININVNINVRIQKDLEQVFGFEDEMKAKTK